VFLTDERIGGIENDLRQYFSEDCRGRNDPNCVGELIEKAFNQAFSDPRLQVSISERYPGGLAPQDIQDVNVLPTGIDFVIRPEKCSASWKPPPEPVNFEHGLVKAWYPLGYAGYCSLGDESL
jgi:hypothetical protein